MPIVVDASLLVALSVNDARAPKVEALVKGWLVAGEQLHAPALAPNELARGSTRLAVARAFPTERVGEAWQIVNALPITYHSVTNQGEEIITIALTLGRQSAYDAAYLELARRLNAQLWTLDGSLVRNATRLGFPVHLVD